jgi:hypothetical protein|tara:strand:+ start:101 stop:532 length:432 start_codon:yes stop_codon:yes gene_type:complete
MANVKISELTLVTTPLADSEVAIVQNGVTSKITHRNLTREILRVADHNMVNVASSQTINLSTTVSVNMLIIANPGLTLTIQFPTSPIEGQVCEFTTLTNTVTLIAGTGNFNPSFAGAPVAGFNATYLYHETDNTWYLVSGKVG